MFYQCLQELNRWNHCNHLYIWSFLLKTTLTMGRKATVLNKLLRIIVKCTSCTQYLFCAPIYLARPPPRAKCAPVFLCLADYWGNDILGLLYYLQIINYFPNILQPCSSPPPTRNKRDFTDEKKRFAARQRCFWRSASYNSNRFFSRRTSLRTELAIYILI